MTVPSPVPSGSLKPLIGFLIQAIIFAAVIWLILLVAAYLTVPAIVITVIKVIAGLAIIIWLLRVLAAYIP